MGQTSDREMMKDKQWCWSFVTQPTLFDQSNSQSLYLQTASRQAPPIQRSRTKPRLTLKPPIGFSKHLD